MSDAIRLLLAWVRIFENIELRSRYFQRKVNRLKNSSFPMLTFRLFYELESTLEAEAKHSVYILLAAKLDQTRNCVCNGASGPSGQFERLTIYDMKINVCQESYGRRTCALWHHVALSCSKSIGFAPFSPKNVILPLSLCKVAIAQEHHDSCVEKRKRVRLAIHSNLRVAWNLWIQPKETANASKLTVSDIRGQRPVAMSEVLSKAKSFTSLWWAREMTACRNVLHCTLYTVYCKYRVKSTAEIWEEKPWKENLNAFNAQRVKLALM